MDGSPLGVLRVAGKGARLQPKGQAGVNGEQLSAVPALWPLEGTKDRLWVGLGQGLASCGAGHPPGAGGAGLTAQTHGGAAAGERG